LLPVIQEAISEYLAVCPYRLERAARMRGVLLVSNGQGGLVITRADAKTERSGAVLERGVNIMAGRGEFSHRERFSEYTVKGQSPDPDGFLGAAAAAGQKGEAEDAGIARYRPLAIIAEHGGGAQKFKERAEWEAAVRYGRASRVTYSLQNWNHAAGLWRPPTLVSVRDDWMGYPDATLLIAALKFVLDERGTRTDLELMPPEAFSRIALPEPKETGGVLQA